MKKNIFNNIINKLIKKNLLEQKTKSNHFFELDYPSKKINIFVDSSYERTLRIHSCRKESMTVEWIDSISPSENFFDIGSNIGAYSLIAASRGIKSFSFEPAYFNFNRLCQNIQLNNFNNLIIPFCCAVGSKNQFLSMSFSSLEPGSALHDTSHSSVINNGMIVSCFTLDTICNKFGIEPNNLKIDVDGGEVDVLLGAEKTLKNTKLKSILIEVDTNQKTADEKIDYLISSSGFNLNWSRNLFTEGLCNKLYIRS